MQESEAVGDYKETSGHSRTAACRSSQQLHKPEQVQSRPHLNVDRKFEHDIPSLAEELVATVNFWKMASP